MIRDPVDSEINPLHQEDIVYYIFSYLLKKELLEVARVCTQWNLISSSCPQWKRIHLFTNESSREIFQIGQDYVTPQIIGRYSGENLFELTYEFDGTKLNDSNFLQIIQACKNIQTLRLLGNSIFDFSLCGPFVKPGKLMKTHQRNLGQAIHDFSPNIFNIYLANVRNLDIRGLMIVKVLEIVVWVESLMPQLESLKLGWVFESDDLHFFRPTWQFNLIHFHVNAIALSKAKKDLAPKQLQTFSMIGFSQGVNCELIKDFVAPCNLLANLNLCCSFYLFDEEEESYQFFQQLTLANNAISDVNLRATELNDRSLICIAENCPNLRRINIGCTQVTKNGVDKLLDFCTLSHLDLCYCQQITSLGSDQILNLMTKIAKKCSTSLRMLGVGGFQNLIDESFQIVLKDCYNIIHLGIGGCPKLTSLSFENIVKYIGNSLMNLNAHNLVQIPEPAWLLLFHGCAKLEILQADDNPQVDQTIFSKYRSHEIEDW